MQKNWHTNLFIKNAIQIKNKTTWIKIYKQKLFGILFRKIIITLMMWGIYFEYDVWIIGTCVSFKKRRATTYLIALPFGAITPS